MFTFPFLSYCSRTGTPGSSISEQQDRGEKRRDPAKEMIQHAFYKGSGESNNHDSSLMSAERKRLKQAGTLVTLPH